MKRISLLPLPLVLLFFSISALAQNSFTITGYSIGEQKVNDARERLITSNVVTPIGSLLAHANGKNISIIVLGYADQTGKHADNDTIGQARADQVKSYLLESFPEAFIIARSKGDEKNSRMVTISWNLIPAATTPPLKKDGNAPVLAVLAMATFLLAVGLVRIARRNRKALTATPQPKEKTEEEFHYQRDGKQFAIPVKIKNGQFETPFPNLKDPSTFNTRATRRETQKVIDLFMGKLFEKPDVQKLIRNGTIRLKEESHV